VKYNEELMQVMISSPTERPQTSRPRAEDNNTGYCTSRTITILQSTGSPHHLWQADEHPDYAALGYGTLYLLPLDIYQINQNQMVYFRQQRSITILQTDGHTDTDRETDSDSVH